LFLKRPVSARFDFQAYAEQFLPSLSGRGFVFLGEQIDKLGSEQYKANNGVTITLRFDDAHAQDPLPVEVRIVDYSFSTNGMPRYETRIIRTSARINVPVDPAS